MTTAAVDYEQLVEEVRSVALQYTGQEWPVIKKSVCRPPQIRDNSYVVVWQKDVEISSYSIPGNKCKV